MNFAEKAVIMNASDMNRAIKRMAHEVIEAHKGVENLVVLGVQRRGVPLARKLAEAIKQVEGTELAQGLLVVVESRRNLTTGQGPIKGILGSGPDSGGVPEKNDC